MFKHEDIQYIMQRNKENILLCTLTCKKNNRLYAEIIDDVYYITNIIVLRQSYSWGIKGFNTP